MKKQANRILAGSLVVSALVASSAYGARPPSRNLAVATITLSDAAGDVQRSDGGGAYAASDIRTAHIRDFRASRPDLDTATKTQDLFYLSSTFGGSRQTLFNYPLASAAEYGPGSIEPIRCLRSYFHFESSTTPDWAEELNAAGGGSVKGWGVTGCYTSRTAGYHAFYPPGTSSTLATECLRMSRYKNVFGLSASDGGPGGSLRRCVADIFSFDTLDGERTYSDLGTSPAAFGMVFKLSRDARSS